MQVSEEFIKCSIALMEKCCNNFVNQPVSLNSKTIIDTVEYLKKQSIQIVSICGVDLSRMRVDMAKLIDGTVQTAWPCIWKAYYGEDGHPNKTEFYNFIVACNECIHLLETTIQLDKESGEQNIRRYKNLTIISTSANNASAWKESGSGTSTYWSKDCVLDKQTKNANIDRIMEYHKKIKEIDPDYTIPKRPKAEGCYIATCVYGSYDCPQVWTLRRYRDEKLACTWQGRAFIRLYYALSPTIVSVLGKRNWFRAFWKKNLDIKVKKLQKKGFESSPYNDRQWRLITNVSVADGNWKIEPA